MTIALERLTDDPIPPPRIGLPHLPIAASLLFHLALLLLVAGLLRGAGVIAPSPLAGAVAVRVVTLPAARPDTGSAQPASALAATAPAAIETAAVPSSEISPQAIEEATPLLTVPIPAPPAPAPVPTPAPPVTAAPRIVTWPTIAIPTAPPWQETHPPATHQAKPASRPKTRRAAARPEKPATPAVQRPADLAVPPPPAAGKATGEAGGVKSPASPSPSSLAGDAAPVIDDPHFRERPVPPIYPERARILAQQGEVQVRVLLGLDGDAERIVLWRSSGFDLLDQAALAAVHRWRFAPARRNGGSIRAWVQVPVRFFLN